MAFLSGFPDRHKFSIDFRRRRMLVMDWLQLWDVTAPAWRGGRSLTRLWSRSITGVALCPLLLSAIKLTMEKQISAAQFADGKPALVAVVSVFHNYHWQLKLGILGTWMSLVMSSPSEWYQQKVMCAEGTIWPGWLGAVRQLRPSDLGRDWTWKNWDGTNITLGPWRLLTWARIHFNQEEK